MLKIVLDLSEGKVHAEHGGDHVQLWKIVTAIQAIAIILLTLRDDQSDFLIVTKGIGTQTVELGSTFYRQSSLHDPPQRRRCSRKS